MPKQKTSPPPAPPEADTLDVEQALAELAALVDELGAGAQPREQVALTRRCQAALRAAEQKVEILARDSAEGGLEPFEPEQ